MAGSFPYELEVATLDGDRTALEDYRGKVLLVVNTAREPLNKSPSEAESAQRIPSR